jgi:hypothetical protein
MKRTIYLAVTIDELPADMSIIAATGDPYEQQPHLDQRGLYTAAHFEEKFKDGIAKGRFHGVQLIEVLMIADQGDV